MYPLKIVIADDHVLIREGIKALLKDNNQYTISGEAENGKTCVDILKKVPTDILLLDIDMPEKNGVEVGQWIKSMQLKVKIVFITSHSDFFSFYRAWKLNPAGFLFKENALEDLTNCLQKIEEGHQYFASETQKYIDNNQKKVQAYEAIYNKIGLLSSKEKQVLLYIGENKTTGEIAEKLFNSYKTIENHRYNISRKLAIAGSNNLMKFAIQHYDIIRLMVSKGPV